MSRTTSAPAVPRRRGRVRGDHAALANPGGSQSPRLRCCCRSSHLAATWTTVRQQPLWPGTPGLPQQPAGSTSGSGAGLWSHLLGSVGTAGTGPGASNACCLSRNSSYTSPSKGEARELFQRHCGKIGHCRYLLLPFALPGTRPGSQQTQVKCFCAWRTLGRPELN